jgi:hypothetical protein
MAFQKASHYAKRVSHATRKLKVHASAGLVKRKPLLKKIPGVRHTKHLVGRYKLAFGLCGAIVISVILTAFSVILYEVTGSSKLDLSRPGYEAVRKKISKAPPVQDDFGPTGSLNSKIITQYLANYTKQTQALNSYDSFNPQLLDDTQLGLTDTTVAPTDAPN